MSDQDDATVMLSAIGEEPGGAQQFKDVGAGGEEEATVMWSPEQGGGDIQNAATVMMTADQAAAAMGGAVDQAKPRKAAKAGGSSNKSVMTGLGLLLAFGSMAAVFLLVGAKGAGAGGTGFYLTGGLMLLAYAMVGKGFMGISGGLAKITGILSFLFAIDGILVILTAAGVLKMAFVVVTPWLAGLVFVFAGLWAFTRGGGLGITSGLFTVLGGAAAVAAGSMMLAVKSMDDINTVAMLFLAALGAGGLGAILMSVVMFTKIDRKA